MSAISEVDRLTTVLVKHVRDAFVSQERIDRQWKQLNFSAPPDFLRAADQYDKFLDLISVTGVEVWRLPAGPGLTLDALYTRDASIVCAGGAVLCRMGKRERRGEPESQCESLRDRGWAIAGEIVEPGTLEGGDVV